MNRAFTLLELLVVIAIMAILGGITVSGYRQMKRGMEERGTVQNANQFIRSAYQRAQIDRQPVAIYFWNETLKGRTSEEFEVVVGRAVAVRRAGRLTGVVGNDLYDEFGDLKFLVPSESDEDEGFDDDTSPSGAGINLYQLNGDEKEPIKSVVYEIPKRISRHEEPLLSQKRSKNFEIYAYTCKPGKGNASWKVGDAYGFEFAEITLPHGYIFGSSYSRDVRNPITDNGMMLFSVSSNSGDGGMSGADSASTIIISSLRPDKSGALSAQKVGTIDSPTKSLD